MSSRAPRRRLLALAALVALIHAACSGSEDDDGRYSSLLRLVPTSTAISSDGRGLTAVLRGVTRMRTAFFAEPLILHDWLRPPPLGSLR